LLSNAPSTALIMRLTRDICRVTWLSFAIGLIADSICGQWCLGFSLPPHILRQCQAGCSNYL